MTARINWYRALPLAGRHPLPAVAAPTLYLWGDGDHYITRYAAERNSRYVQGRYRFEVLAGASHWLPSAEAERISPLVAAHLASVPG